MASFFGSVATKVGEGLQENANAAAEQARELQLQKQRQAFETGLLDHRLKAEDRRAKTRLDADLAMQKANWEFQAQSARDLQSSNERRDTIRDRSAMDRVLVQEYSDMWQSVVNLYTKHSGTKSYSGNGLEVEVKSELVDIMTPNGIEKKRQEVVYVSAENRSPMRLENGAFQNIGPNIPPPYDFGASEGKENYLDQKMKAEENLASGAISEKEFLEAFQYLPVDYVWGQVTKDDQDFKSFTESQGIRLPTFSEFISERGGSRGDDGSPRTTIAAPSPTAAAAPTTPLATAAAEDTGPPAETVADTAAVDPSSMPSIMRSGQDGALAQGQAASGELPAPITQGNSPELDDNGAAEVSRHVALGVGQVGQATEATEQLNKNPDPLALWKDTGAAVAEAVKVEHPNTAGALQRALEAEKQKSVTP